MRQNVDCPDVEVLERFVAKRLDVVAEENFQSHLAVCGLCGELVERLRDFNREAAALAPEPDWTAMEARLVQACRDRPAAIPHTKATPARWWQNFPLVPVLGYGLAATLVYPAWIGWTRKVTPLVPPPPVLQARAFPGSAAGVLDFNTVRGDQAPAVLEARAGVGAAALVFFLPVGPQEQPAAKILDESGAVVADFGAIASFDRIGNFCVVALIKGWTPGRYRLVVHPQPGQGQSGLPHTFPFLIR